MHNSRGYSPLFFIIICYTICMSKICVGVLRGGTSREYDLSLKTGANVLKHLPEEKYEPRDIFIDRNGQWHVRGFPVTPSRAIENVDVLFNALHGRYGEDGQLQKLLSFHGTPYTASEALPSAIAMNKVMTKDRLRESGMRLPLHRVLERTQDLAPLAFELFRTFPQPSIIKPIDGGASRDVLMVHTYAGLVEGLEDAFDLYPNVLLEEYIQGKEATVAVVEGFRGEQYYALPPVEIKPHQGRAFYDYQAKHTGAADLFCPSTFSPEEKKELERLARDIHQTLRLRHYSRSDFIVTPRGIYFLETNTQPELTDASRITHALDAVGSNLSEFLDQVVTQALI